jgi:hypothetical protein
MQSLSEKAWVRPRKLQLVPFDGDSPAAPFDWLVVLCQAAKQEAVLRRVCFLFGNLKCPLCAAEFAVMPEIQRCHAESDNS